MDLVSIVFAVSLVLGGLWLTGRHRIGGWSMPLQWRKSSRNAGHLEEQKRLVEAIAAWTEGLRDAISGSSGIEHAIITTGRFAPAIIEPQVSRLVASLRYEPLTLSLKRFANEVGHPTCDFVVVALVTAAENQTRELSLLLSHLSECARSECESYLRIWVSRARSRSAVRIISWSVLIFTAGLFVFNRAYVSPYFSPTGAVVGFTIVVVFAASLAWLRTIARIDVPTRLFSQALTGA